MSAEMRARQLTRFDSAWRLTPRTFAPSVTLRPSDSRQDTRTTLPVLFVELGVLPVSGTPTLLLVGSDGLVTHSWIGLLDAKREAELLRVLFG